MPLFKGRFNGQLIQRIKTNQPLKKIGWGIAWAFGAASAAYLTGFLKGCGLGF